MNPGAALKTVIHWKPVVPDPDMRGLGTVVKMAGGRGQNGKRKTLKILSGHPLVIPRVLDALKEWKFAPYLLNGRPMAVTFDLYVPVRPHVNTTLEDIRKSTAQSERTKA